MGLLIDASILIQAERGRLNVAQNLQDRLEDETFLSVITASELLHGVHRARDIQIRTRRSAWVEGILAKFPLLNVDLEVARAHARIAAELASQGTPIEIHDVWLAATCEVYDLTIVTANVRDFERVSGLRVEEWPIRA